MADTDQTEIERASNPAADTGTNRQSGGYPLSLLFLLTAVFAIMVASVSPVANAIKNSSFKPAWVAASIVIGIGVCLVYATVYALYTHSRIRGLLVGWAAAFTVGLIGPPLVFLTAQDLGMSIISIVVGSAFLVISAGLIRATSR